MRLHLPRWLSSRLRLTLDQTLRFSRLTSVLKNDILLVYPATTPAHKAPPVLSPVFQEFLADAVGIDSTTVTSAWSRLKKDIWELPPPVLSNEEEDFFRKYGWKRGLTSLTLYPPSHYCDNPTCTRDNPLKKAATRQVIVYTLNKGAMPAYEVQLYCETCKTTYFPDFSVHNRVRTYYNGIPDFIQIGAHQFAERRLVGMWISLMLVAWVSATNCAKSYDLSLSQQEVYDMSSGGWQFGCKLTTNHVYDAFIILTLLDYHQRNHTNLVVPHNGEQKDRFMRAMEARNDEVIRLGQDVNDKDDDDAALEDAIADDLVEDIEWYEADAEGNVHLRRQDHPGSIGAVNEDECESSKSATGNREYTALFGRCRTHNEQLLIWPCGIIFARATFYNAEAVSNVLRFVQTVFSVPGACKPEHLVYDTNCDAKQQVEANKQQWRWFADVGMSVDVFHFLHKHSAGHVFCNENCNPILFPEMLADDGVSWYFNTSIAEQTNVWFGGYHAMLREMLPVKYNFFLDEMVRLRNLTTMAKLADD
ncbi:hypothetical protein MKEN_00576900 [Mycena kentingensis (nom. inval.)]|nr:hypothetical protein MKEN_00576900 [Mycena kentingensis (nom. inval.)]